MRGCRTCNSPAPTAPFQYSRNGVHIRECLCRRIAGRHGHRSGRQPCLYDLTGSTASMWFGYDFYKSCMARGSARVGALGPVLGPDPLLAHNVERLKAISTGSASFHMSGTEAVMVAVRLARYHNLADPSGAFRGAYHGWWAMQPGVGKPGGGGAVPYPEGHAPDALWCCGGARDIACVLINPPQALHPNGSAPGDSSPGGLAAVARRFRSGGLHRPLKRLREMCTERGPADLRRGVHGLPAGAGGAQEYFGSRSPGDLW